MLSLLCCSVSVAVLDGIVASVLSAPSVIGVILPLTILTMQLNWSNNCCNIRDKRKSGAKRNVSHKHQQPGTNCSGSGNHAG
eukprot:COSAG02_NODE_985_length_15457_cov_108.738247_15_plen_82_part_00